MKRLLCLLFAATLHTGPAEALENEIVVLPVLLPGASSPNAVILLQELASRWSATSSTPIVIANGGAPIPVTIIPPSGDAVAQVNKVHTAMLATNLREIYHADVVLAFTGSATDGTTSVCGAGPQYNWTDLGGASAGFVAGPDGTDRRGSEDSYIALIVTDSVCSSTRDLAMHELGHLFGAGHVKNSTNTNFYLFGDSHADRFGMVTTQFITVVAMAQSPLDIPTYFFASTTGKNNQRAVNRTDTSVANYRSSSCELAKPENMDGFPVVFCNASGWTGHFVEWDDTCPEASVDYEVWGSQPLGSPYEFEWRTVLTATSAWVTGSAAGMKAKTCDLLTCTDRSDSTYIATWWCNP